MFTTSIQAPVYSVAAVETVRGLQLVVVHLAIPPNGSLSRCMSPKEHSALGASHKVLKHIDHLGVAFRSLRPLNFGLLGLLPSCLVDQLRDRDWYPGLLRLLVDLSPIFSQRVPLLPVPPCALICRVAQHAADGGTIPVCASMLGQDAIRHEFTCDAVGPHPLVDALSEDSLHDLGLIFLYFGITALAPALSIRDLTGGNPTLLGHPPPTHGCAFPEAVNLDLPDSGHETEGLYVDGVHHSFQPDLMGLHHLHQGGCRVHATAQPVSLPADDGIEQSPPSIGQHALKLGAALRPAVPNLLVPRSDDESLVHTIGLHIRDLLDPVYNIGCQSHIPYV